MKVKHVLAIETATARGSIALLRDGKVLDAPCIGERFDHSQTLMPQLQKLLKAHRLRVTDIDMICVSKGPGSFTGLRVGIACAKGLGLGLRIPLIGISTFEVLLAGFLRDHTAAPDRIQLLIDARKSEFYGQFWQRGKKSAWVARAPKILPEAQVADALKPHDFLVSPQLSKLRGLLSAPSQQSKDSAVFFDTKDRFPDAADLAILGWKKFRRQRRGDADVQPFYLRKTDAEILFKNKPRSVFRWERGK